MIKPSDNISVTDLGYLISAVDMDFFSDEMIELLQRDFRLLKNINTKQLLQLVDKVLNFWFTISVWLLQITCLLNNIIPNTQSCEYFYSSLIE